jgi:hypothetical protein
MLQIQLITQHAHHFLYLPLILFMFEQSEFKPKAIKTVRSKYSTTLGRRKKWELKALARIRQRDQF